MAAESDDTFGWLDVDLIGELLAEHHPQRDPRRIGFVELKALVKGLAGFQEVPGHGVNEKILEHIQAAWIAERDGRPPSDDDE
ncbi:MAG: Fe-S cluster assembly protein IscX [Phycisphaerales bacterium]